MNPLLSLKDTKKVKRADFNNPFAITYDNPPEDGRFLAEQEAAFGTLQTGGFLNHLDSGTFSEVRLTVGRRCRPSEVVGFVGLGCRYFDTGPVGLDPVYNVLSPETRRITGCLV